MNVLRLAALTACAAGALLASVAHAQPVYRIVGPDGKVSFSDRAPDDKAKIVNQGAAGAASGGQLPYALGQVAQRFPVTLYTSNDCSPCTSARNLLINRGVPFTERTVNSNDDIDAFKRLSGDTNLPFGTIGSQQLKGFSDAEWTQYLDLAGYPKESQLPASYRRAAATPLVAEKSIAQTPGTAESAASAPVQNRLRREPPPPPPPGTPTPSNPAGIRF